MCGSSTVYTSVDKTTTTSDATRYALTFYDDTDGDGSSLEEAWAPPPGALAAVGAEVAVALEAAAEAKQAGAGAPIDASVQAEAAAPAAVGAAVAVGSRCAAGAKLPQPSSPSLPTTPQPASPQQTTPPLALQKNPGMRHSRRLRPPSAPSSSPRQKSKKTHQTKTQGARVHGTLHRRPPGGVTGRTRRPRAGG